VNQKLTLAAYLEAWVVRIRKTRRYKTYELYEGLVRKHLMPLVGGLDVRLVKRRHVREVLDGLGGNVGSRTRQLIFRVLRQVFAEAIEDELITVNPCFRKDKPRHETRERRVLDLQEVRRLLVAAKRGDYYVLFFLALATGMRQGEIFGLCWDAIDFETSSLYVRVSLARDEQGRMILLPPKTSRKRRLDIGDALCRMLLQHKHRQPDGPWVFVDRDGEPLAKDRFVRGVFQPLLKEAGIGRIRFHDLRHTSATLALSSGINVKVVSERLGHSSAQMTLDVYTRALPTLQREAASQMESLIKGQVARRRRLFSRR